MKILALLTDGFGCSGGIARYNTDLVRALSSSPTVSGVVALPRYGDRNAEVPNGVYQVAPKASSYLWALHAVYLAFFRGVDAIFCGHMNAAPFASLLSRLSRKPLWIQAHGIEAWEDRGPRFRKALSRAGLITAVSRHTRRRLLSWSDVAPDIVRVLPNTFDANFSAAPANLDLASRLGVGGKKVILTVGRMVSSERYKGHDRIIRCLPAIKSQIPNIVYMIVGTGDDRQRLEDLALELGVHDVLIFAGFVPDRDLKDYYALADVFAMPSTGEGFGIVFLEAAAAGLSVIGGNQDGSLDALADGAVGLGLDPDDAGALTVALIAALQAPVKPQLNGIDRFELHNFTYHVADLVQYTRN